MPRRKLTPEDRAKKIEKVNRTAKRSYKKTNKKRTLSTAELQQIQDILIPLKAVGYSNMQCGIITGLPKGQIAEISKDEKIQDRITKLKVTLPTAARDLLRAYMVEAVMALVHVMRTTKDEDKILKSAADILDRGGLPKASRSEVQNTFDGNPEDERNSEKALYDALRQADPEVQEAAAQLRDAFEEGVASLLKGGQEENGSSGQNS